MAGKNENIDIAFPASYFYPLGCYTKTMEREAWVEHGAYAVRHWGKTWMPVKYRLSEFQTIDNNDTVQTWNDD